MNTQKTRVKHWMLCGTLGVAGLAGGAMWAQSGQPVLAVKQPTHDFGLVEPGGEAQHAFEIENTGRQPLKIKKINVSCGCIKDAHVNADTIAPGQKTYLSLVWESPPYKKDVQETIEMETNDPAHPVQQFVVKAKVQEPQFSIEPAVVNFGIVEGAEVPVTEEIIVEKTGVNDAKDKVVFSAPENYFHTKVEKAQNNKWKLSLSLQPDSPVGPINGQVIIAPSWGGSKKLLILGQVVGSVAAEPGEIYVDTSKSKAGTESILVSNEKGKVAGLKILSVSPTLGKTLKTTITNDQVAVTYDLTSPTAPKSAKGSILLEAKLNGGETKKVIVPVTFVS